METNKEIFEKINSGEISLEEFENWVSDNRQDAYDKGYNNGWDSLQLLNDSF